MACQPFIPINTGVTAIRRLQSHSPPTLHSDARHSPSTPTSSFREAILIASERLERPLAKKRKAIESKPHNGRSKLKKNHTTNASPKPVIPVNNTFENEGELSDRRKRDHGQVDPDDRASSTYVSRKTIDRLDTFRFRLPQEAATQRYNSERPLAQEAPLMGDEPLADTALLDNNSRETQKLKENSHSQDPEQSLEATFPVDHDVIGQCRTRDKRQLFDNKNDSSSPSPFDIDDYDDGLLQDICAAAGDRRILHSSNSSDYGDNGNPFSDQDAPHKSSIADSDFGSDPFEYNDSGQKEEPHQYSFVFANSLCFSQQRSPQASSPSPRANVESTLPLSYQRPSKSASTKTTPPTLSACQPITPIPHTTHKPPENVPPPFLRTSFPKIVTPLSPIPNLTSASRILTCFRIAEYFRAISPSTPSSGLLIELYALVTYSVRVGGTQYFTFADLFFPHRPPHLQGTYMTWQGSELYEDDTRPFLGTVEEQGTLCRAIVRPDKSVRPHPVASTESTPLAKKFGVDDPSTSFGCGEGGGSSFMGAEVQVLNIWKADWEDVNYVRGIVSA